MAFKWNLLKYYGVLRISLYNFPQTFISFITSEYIFIESKIRIRIFNVELSLYPSGKYTVQDLLFDSGHRVVVDTPSFIAISYDKGRLLSTQLGQSMLNCWNTAVPAVGVREHEPTKNTNSMQKVSQHSYL